MSNRFKVGDHVRWNSEAGHVTGRIIKLHARDTEYKGHPRHASDDEPQCEIRSETTEHSAMHKGSALHKTPFILNVRGFILNLQLECARLQNRVGVSSML